jgi:hypothetical protein
MTPFSKDKNKVQSSDLRCLVSITNWISVCFIPNQKAKRRTQKKKRKSYIYIQAGHRLRQRMLCHWECWKVACTSLLLQHLQVFEWIHLCIPAVAWTIREVFWWVFGLLQVENSQINIVCECVHMLVYILLKIKALSQLEEEFEIWQFITSCDCLSVQKIKTCIKIYSGKKGSHALALYFSSCETTVNRSSLPGLVTT